MTSLTFFVGSYPILSDLCRTFGWGRLIVHPTHDITGAKANERNLWNGSFGTVTDSQFEPRSFSTTPQGRSCEQPQSPAVWMSFPTDAMAQDSGSSLAAAGRPCDLWPVMWTECCTGSWVAGEPPTSHHLVLTAAIRPSSVSYDRSARWGHSSRTFRWRGGRGFE